MDKDHNMLVELLNQVYELIKEGRKRQYQSLRKSFFIMWTTTLPEKRNFYKA